MYSLEENLDNKKNHKIIVKELIDNLKGEVIEIVKMLDDYIKKIEEIKNDQGDGLKKITNEEVCYHETLLKIFRDKKEIYIRKALYDSVWKLVQDKQNQSESIDQSH